ncbi:MAG: hypothetical protein NW223_22330 [Hyphomicrobiaceae bacterium]|nr:hypothetical protein [Hyphomicrobiaceae bacterium]
MRATATRCLLAGALAAILAPQALAAAPYLSEAAIREAIVGQTLDGHYGNGITWSEAYLADGRLDYRETGGRNGTGRWSFRPGDVLCTFYDPAPGGSLVGGCWLVLKTSANCFEFFLSSGGPPADSEEGLAAPLAWNAQGWRRGEPSTCAERPAV